MTSEPTRFVSWNIAVALSIYGIVFIVSTGIAALFGEGSTPLIVMIGVSVAGLAVLVLVWLRMDGRGGLVERLAYLMGGSLIGFDLLGNLATLFAAHIR
ncbi:hypothetical protein EKN06_00005 [Croceicoccus ponticola]|uniref:Uncharacterized protein n=1 Tax=Croceicoccus ponticola TaxID=2217664 RepID=A0A437GZ89_9SPHN|nr:hypothetical protein [Croceicoccus ponticola]RVQ68662.1 hypothetical protein EKN06_00005 [Croceicoccus ponticola]